MAKTQSPHTTVSGTGSLAAELVQRLGDYLDQQKNICARLEKIADALPAIDDAEAMREFASTLPTLLRAVHAYEELRIFPALLNNGPLLLAGTIERLKEEHASDEDYADDVCLAIETYLIEQDRNRAESLSWMLRGFFENIRRHIAYEREHILPLANQIGKPTL
ncbi:MAG: hemerythrin domain-containing protein [Alphaproteobacteria bacterium]|nr:hemerythrin domain-containing protein [Alphaproteobacteria bacterium]